MNRRLEVFTGLLLVTCFCSCDGQTVSEIYDENVPAKGLDDDVSPGDTTTDLEELNENQGEKEEGPFGIVSAIWPELGIKGGSAIDVLKLQVKNEIDVPVIVEAEIVCDAFIDKTATKSMSPKTQVIPVGGETIFTLPVNAMPIQVLSGAGAFKAKLHAVVEKDDGVVERVVHSSQFLFRHNIGFKTVDVFGLRALVNEKEGVFLDTANTNNIVVGRSIDEAGIATTIFAEGAKKTVIGEDGKS